MKLIQFGAELFATVHIAFFFPELYHCCSYLRHSLDESKAREVRNLLNLLYPYLFP